jgi:NAD(P)-dependent dehydrogenase (short-subunit alcohol dehydrogenase family)
MTRTILVTGAGSGIGRAVVERLLLRGDQVIASARNTGQIAEFAARGVTVVGMDVGSDASVREGFADIGADFGKLDAVVHCAAVCPVGTVEFTPPERFAETFNTNTLGSLRILQSSLPFLRQAPSGRILLVTSLWGKVSGPFVSSYASSKHSIEAIADSFRRETIGGSVRVSVVEPGVILTKMFDQALPDLERQLAGISPEEARLYGELYGDHRKLLSNAGGKGATTADQCAAAIERALDARNPKARYVIGKDAKAMVTMGRILSDRALDRVFGLLYKGKAT